MFTKFRVKRFAKLYDYDTAHKTNVTLNGCEVWEPDYKDGQVRYTKYPRLSL